MKNPKHKGRAPELKSTERTPRGTAEVYFRMGTQFYSPRLRRHVTRQEVFEMIRSGREVRAYERTGAEDGPEATEAVVRWALAWAVRESATIRVHDLLELARGAAA